MKRTAFLSLALLPLLAAAPLGCSSSTLPPQVTPDCEVITSACHAAEDLSAEAAECHDVAHEGVLALCTAEKTRCVTLCTELLGAGGAGGAGGEGGQGGAATGEHDH